MSSSLVGQSLYSLYIVGRSYMYELAKSGAQGVEWVVRGILYKAELTLGLCGFQVWMKFRVRGRWS